MGNLESITRRRDDDESVLVRNVDLARQRLIRREGELEHVLREKSMSRKERQRFLSYAISGLDAAHTELRDAVSDLASFGGEDQQSLRAERSSDQRLP